MHAAQRSVAVVLTALSLCGCRSADTGSHDPSIADLDQPGFDASHVLHTGPGISLGNTGTARFAGALLAAFDAKAAMALVAKLDALHRTVGSADFERGLDLLAERLAGGGFGAEEGLELEWLDTPLDGPAWTGLSGKVTLVRSGGGETVLHAFDTASDSERTLLPVGAPSANVEGRVRFELDQIELGDVFVSESQMRRDLVTRARRQGAAAVVCGGLEPYNIDPSGAERHLDAVGLRTLPSELGMPVAQVSPRSFAAIRAAAEAGETRLRIEARSELGDASSRTLVATIRGGARASEAVVLVSHGGGPGAINNASGAAGLTECAVAIARLLREGKLQRPARSLVFVVGPELAGTRAWLASTEFAPVAAVDLVMIGSSPERTGAVCLLERHPDPGAGNALPPDAHTQWGFRPPEADWLVPNGLAIVARQALADVALRVGGWPTAENPYEGGTDHEVLLAAGIPTVLFWHFTDFTFYTNLDRLGMVDGDELERTAVAGATTALALADPRPADLERYLAALNTERRVRLRAAEDAERMGLRASWVTWFDGARMWLRAHCLGLELPAPVPLPPIERRPPSES